MIALLLLLLLLLPVCIYGSDESQEKYLKYQDTSKGAELQKLDDPTLEPTPAPDTKEIGEGVTLKVYDKRGLTVSVDGKVVLFIKDHITEIRIKKEEEKKDCTLL